MSNILPYIRDSYIDKNGKCLISLQLHLSKRKVTVKTDISVESEYWDYDNRCVKKNHKDHKDLNMILGQCVDRANRILVRYRLMEKQLTTSAFKLEYKNPANHIDFYEWLENEIKARKGTIEDSTIAMHNSLLNCMMEFKGSALFAEIDCQYIEDFDRFMKQKKFNNLNTRNKKMRAFRSYLNRAVNRGIIKENPFSKVKIRTGNSNPTYLTEKELKTLITQYIKEIYLPHLQRVLRYFLFACFTGLRISDVKRLTWEKIEDDMITMGQKKLQNVNEGTVRIPLCQSAKILIGYKKGIQRNGYVFDCYSDQKTNEYIKDIMILAKLDKTISFHVARHSFATLFLEKTDDLATLQKLLGHSSINQTMVYAHVTERKKRDQIRKFDKDYSTCFNNQ